MELNKEQIIKALECCHTDKFSCIDCPFQYLNKFKECTNINKNAVALIKELAEENERLRGENEQWRNDWERNQSQWEEAYGKLEQENIEQDEAIIRALKEMGKIRQETKADTVRKMQERLDKRFCHDPAFLGVEQRLIMDVIDQIAKEILEGGDQE